MATNVQELAAPLRGPCGPAFQPDYPDEVSPEQLDAIRRATDPNGDKAGQRTLIHSPAW